MIKITKPTLKHAKLLSKLGTASFLVSHGHSASKKDIDKYVAENFSEENFKSELENPENEYYLIYYQDKIAGFSKIIFNSENENITAKNVALMSRLYLLEEFYGLGLGKELFNFNVKLSKQNKQKGIWLAVWVENPRAITFYKKIGFKKVGNYNFKISETHANPNHILYLAF
jgi:ribosomal protein S18 acetylase RimI-like enzyme